MKPGAIGMLHWIGKDIPQATDTFMHLWLYPGAQLAPLGRAIEYMGHNGLEILDIENLRRHYHHTLNGWLENFENHWAEMRKINPKSGSDWDAMKEINPREFYDESYYRLYKAYLSLCSTYFIVPNSVLRLWQVTFSKGDTTIYPMNRDFIYDKKYDRKALRKSSWQQITDNILKRSEIDEPIISPLTVKVGDGEEIPAAD